MTRRSHQSTSWRVRAPTGSGTNIFVATSGSDSSGAGTFASPYQSIAKAHSVAVAGSVVHVAPGNYVTGEIDITTAGTASNRITYWSTTLWGAVLIGGAATGSNNAAVYIGASYIDFMGFQVDGTLATGANWWRIGIMTEATCVNSTVQYCKVHDILRNATDYASADTGSGGAGILADNFYGNASGVLVNGNIVYNIGTDAGVSSEIQGIYMVCPGTYSNNLVYNVAACGMQAWHGAISINVLNNTIDGVRDYGIVVGSGDSGATGSTGDFFNVFNNVVSNSYGSILETGTTGVHNVYTNNICFNSALGGHSNTPVLQNGLATTGTLTTDPLYVNSGARNYLLAAGSPARVSGTVGPPVVTTDITGKVRSGTPDRGAYQVS